MTIVVTLTTLPSEKAKDFAYSLVQSKMAACVNIVPKILSVYGFKGEIQEEEEALLVVKSAVEKHDALRAFIEEQHPYDVPEILWFSDVNASKSYRDFVRDWVL